MVTKWGLTDEVGTVNYSADEARSILKKNKKQLEKLAKALLEFETLTGSEIKDLLAGKKIKKKVTNLTKDGSSVVPNVADEK